MLHYHETLHYPLTPLNTALSSQDGLPLSQPLRANKEGLYGEEHQALPQGLGERWEPSGWEGRDWKIHTPRSGGKGLVSTVISVTCFNAWDLALRLSFLQHKVSLRRSCIHEIQPENQTVPMDNIVYRLHKCHSIHALVVRASNRHLATGPKGFFSLYILWFAIMLVYIVFL